MINQDLRKMNNSYDNRNKLRSILNSNNKKMRSRSYNYLPINALNYGNRYNTFGTNSNQSNINNEINLDLDNLTYIEGHLNDIISALNSNKNIFEINAKNECFQFLKYYKRCSLFNKFPSFFTSDKNHLIIKSAFNLHLFIVLITYNLSSNQIMMNKLISLLEKIYFLLKINFFLIVHQIESFNSELYNDIHFKTCHFFLDKRGFKYINENDKINIINNNCISIANDIKIMLNLFQAMNNKHFFDPEALRANFVEMRPVESLEARPLNLPKKSYVDKGNNEISFAKGSTISLNGGYKLVLRDTGFELSGEVGDERYFEEACSIRGALNRLLTNAEKNTTWRIGDMMKDYNKFESNITKVLSGYGIDTSKDFTFNGMKFVRGENGRIESQREADAKKAYEIQKANNRTYSLADDKTKQSIRYKSDYYLQSVSDEVKNLWNETLEETGANPFVNKYGNTLALMAVEQDFATGGNDQLFGDSVESAIEATRKILDRIDNPIREIPRADQAIYETTAQREREFYMVFLSKLKNL